MGDTSPIHNPRGSRYPNSRVLRPYPYSEWFLDSETLLLGTWTLWVIVIPKFEILHSTI